MKKKGLTMAIILMVLIVLVGGLYYWEYQNAHRDGNLGAAASDQVIDGIGVSYIFSTSSDPSSAVSWFDNNGFQLYKSSKDEFDAPAGQTEFNATVGQLESIFNTTIYRYREGGMICFATGNVADMGNFPNMNVPIPQILSSTVQEIFLPGCFYPVPV